MLRQGSRDLEGKQAAVKVPRWHAVCCACGRGKFMKLTSFLISTILFATPIFAAEDGTEPPSTGVKPGARLHNGFYFRLGTGFGSYNENVQRSGESKSSLVTGIASAGEIAVGGAISPGFILGGGVYSSSVLASDRSTPTKGATMPPPEVIEGRGDFSLIGPFIDYYFDPTKGMHFQAAVGLATVRGLNVESVEVND